MENKYTSLKLSKLLAEAGCEIESHYNIYINNKTGKSFAAQDCIITLVGSLSDPILFKAKKSYPAYDILNDICVKYAKEFFGDEVYLDHAQRKIQRNYHGIASTILYCLQNGQKQEAEDYIIENSIFFNKGDKDGN